MLKAESDVQHLWFGRRAAVRIRSQLMSAIYDKALKRKDFSGIVNKDGKDNKKKDGDTKETKAEKKAKETADDPKAGADVGKIVNLMAGDANRVSDSSNLISVGGLTPYYFLDCDDYFRALFHLRGAIWYVHIRRRCYFS